MAADRQHGFPGEEPVLGDAERSGLGEHRRLGAGGEDDADGRRPGGWAAAVLLTCYLVSHVDALRRARPDQPRLLDRPFGAVARLVVNVLYIAWAVAVARAAA